MRQYGKVPRFDHTVLPEDFFSTGTLHITEKLDGSSFRFFLYETRFSDIYPSEVAELGPSDGDVVFGSRRKLRGVISDEIDSFDGNFHRAVRHLRENVDKEEIRRITDEYGPVVFFAENMVLHSLDYQYSSSPPPAILGFDIYAPEEDNRKEPPSDPFKETFEGYLTPKIVFGDGETLGLFERIGIETVPVIESSIPAGCFTPSPDSVPKSKFVDRQAEGVVIRHLELCRRAKIVTPEFEELNRSAFGMRPSETQDGTELFVATFATNRRIRKIIQKMVIDGDHKFGRDIIEPLRHEVYRDIWEEDWDKIMELDMMFNPRKTVPLIAKRCASVVTQMETNAELNEVSPERLWENI